MFFEKQILIHIFAGDFKYVYNTDKTLAYVLYLPDTAKKDQGGKQCCFFVLFFRYLFVSFQTERQQMQQTPIKGPWHLEQATATTNMTWLMFQPMSGKAIFRIRFGKFSTVFLQIRHHISLIPNLDGPVEEQTLFWEIKNKQPEQGDSFFFNRVGLDIRKFIECLLFQPMGTNTYGKLIKTAVSKLGMDRSGKNTSNQSLRTTTFNAQVIIF